MGISEVMIVFESPNTQPVMLSSVNTIEIKRDNVIVTGYGYRRIYFKSSIKTIETGLKVKIFIK